MSYNITWITAEKDSSGCAKTFQTRLLSSIPVPFSTTVNDAGRAYYQVMPDFLPWKHDGAATISVEARNTLLGAQ